MFRLIQGEKNMNELEKGFLAHHGILGQKWGKRQGPPYPLDEEDHSSTEKKEGYEKSLGGGRNEKLYDRNESSGSDKSASKSEVRKAEKAHKKEVKEKAKNYQRNMNQLQINENNLILKGWELKDSKAFADMKVSKLKENKAEQQKIDEWVNQSKLLEKKMIDVANDFGLNRALIDELDKKISSDKDIVYKTGYMETTYNKDTHEYSKLLEERHGKTTVRGGDGGQHSVSGTRYTVKAGTERNKKKKKYSDPNKKRQYDHRLRSTYYYY